MEKKVDATVSMLRALALGLTCALGRFLVLS